MLKMKLPQRKSKHIASEEEDEEEEERAASAGMCSRPCPLTATAATKRLSLQQETVYEWFVQSLGPCQRLEFVCGLLDLCNPLELRFLGSCLEDLARKDCHYLRDYESRANGLGGEPGSGLQQSLGDLCDPMSRSKMIVHLALLRSENREVAGRLYRLLLVPVMGADGRPGGWEPESQEHGEELLLLFTMASLHPAFSFHQRVTLRERLEQLREAMCSKEDIHEYLPKGEKRGDGIKGTHNGVGATIHNLQQEAVHIESIHIKHVQRRRMDKNSEYTFEVNWSDNSRTSVTKSYRELTEFLLTLPKELSNGNIDKTILDALQLGKKREELQFSDLEPIVKQLFSSPSQDLLHNHRVYKFFQDIPKESGHPSTGHLHSGSMYCKSQEDSSETSSQEEDVMHHMTVHKKPAGKYPATNFVAMKSSPSDAPHAKQNGTDWRRNDSTELPHSQHYINVGHQQHILEKRCSHQTGRETTERNHFPKADGRSIYKANRVKPSQNSRTSTVKDPTLEVGSGHETCGETSSESYSSPPSPRQNRRESFESEDEKDRETDSNSEDSTKNVPGFMTFSAVKSSPAKLSNHICNNEESTLEEALENSNFPHFPLVPTLHCVMPSGTDKLELGLPPSLSTEGKTLGMLVSPVAVSPVREGFHPSSLGIGVSSVASTLGEPEKCIEILTPSLPVPSTFLPRNCQPSSSAVHVPIQRLKVPPQGPAETCTANGSTQTSLGLGSANTGFISFYSPGGFTASPVTASDPPTKPVSQVVSLNQVVPHLDGNAGAMPPTTNLKLVFPTTNLSTAPSSVPYPLPAPSLASGVLPAPNAGVLNAAATQPANGVINQVQALIAPTVPTHSTGPAPSASPALTHSTAQSDSTSFISATVGNTSTNGTLLPPQQMGPGACGSCGRRCSCGNSGGVPVGSYYYPNPITGQMYTRVPPFIIPSICNNTYLSQAHQSNGTQFPVFLHQTPYTAGIMHDPVLGGQANYGMQQMASFARLYPFYPANNVVGNSNGPVSKKNGNISCFNCGVTGHYAQDCKQTPMEAIQQGTFRLRYAPLPNPSHDSLDSAD